MKKRINTYKSIIIILCIAIFANLFVVASAEGTPTEITGNVQYKIVGGDGATAPLKNAKVMLFCEKELKYFNNGYYNISEYDKQGRFTAFTYTDENGNFTLPLELDGVDISQFGPLYIGVCGLSFMRQSYMQDVGFEKRRDYFFSSSTASGAAAAVRYGSSSYTSPWQYDFYALYAIDILTDQTKDVVLENAANPFDGSIGVYLTSDVLCDWGVINTNIIASFTLTRQSDNNVIFDYDGTDFVTANADYPLPLYDKTKRLCTFSGLSADDAYILEATALHKDTGEPIPEFVPAQSMLVIDSALLNTYETLPYLFLENKTAIDISSEIFNSNWNWSNYINGTRYTLQSYSSNLYRIIDDVRYNYNFEVADGQIVNEPYMTEIEFGDGLILQEFERYSAGKDCGAFDITFYNAAGEEFVYKTAFPAHDAAQSNYKDPTLQTALNGFKVKRATIRYNKNYPFDNMDSGVNVPNMNFICTVDPDYDGDVIRNKITVSEDFGSFISDRSTYINMPVIGGAYNVAIDTKKIEGSDAAAPLSNIPIDIYSYRYNETPVFLMHTTSDENGTALLRLPHTEYADYVFKIPNMPDGYTLVTSGYSIGGTTYYDGTRASLNPSANNVPILFAPVSSYSADGAAASYNADINGSLGEDVAVNVSGIQAASMFKNFELVAYIPPGFTLNSITVPAYNSKVGYTVETMAASRLFTPARNVFSSLDMPMRPLRNMPYYTDVENVIPIISPDESTGNRIAAVKVTFDSASFGFMPADGAPITLGLSAGTDIADFTQNGESSVVGNIDLQINKRYSESTLNRSVTDLKTVALTLNTDIGVLNIASTDTAHSPIPGAKFALYANDMQTVLLADVVSNADGLIRINHLAPGTYYIKQTAVPSGFVLNSTSYPVQIANTAPFDITVTNARTGGGGGTATQSPPPSPTPPLEEYETHVQYIAGRLGNIFDPDSPITRAEAAQMFFNVSNDADKSSAAAANFTDIAADEWYSEAVNYLAARSVIIGYGDSTFRPHEPISRAELTKCAVTFSGVGTAYNDSRPFPDITAGFWAEPYIAAQAGMSWVIGYPDGMFRPENGATRAEAVTVINRMLNRKVKNIDLMMPGIRQLGDVPANYWAYADIMEAFNSHKFTREDDGFEAWIALIE